MMHTLRSGLAASLALAAITQVAPPAAAADLSPEMKQLVTAADKEGALALMFGEGALGGTDGAKLFEQQINKTYGTHLKIAFTPGPSMPAMGSQIAMLANARQTSPTD